MDYFNTPIFIISFNRLGYLRQLLQWLEQAGYSNLHIIDNASTYPPLVAYLEQCPHPVHRMAKNYGHLVLWESGQFDHIITQQPFVLTDCDVVPDEECPADVVAHLGRALKRYKHVSKVGLSLRIDDLPEHYALKDKVVAWESQFWQYKLYNTPFYDAVIDTTFAYYRPNIAPDNPKWWRALRSAAPYRARHLPWYVNSAQPASEEDLYYQQQVKAMSSQWSTTDAASLKEQNLALIAEVNALRQELYLLKRPLLRRIYSRCRKGLIQAIDAMGLGRLLRALRHYLPF